MFSCEICGIFKDTYFEEYLQTTAFDIPHDDTISFSDDNIKTCIRNPECIREKLPGKVALLELRILESGDLNLKAHTLKFLMVLLCVC